MEQGQSRIGILDNAFTKCCTILCPQKMLWEQLAAANQLAETNEVNTKRNHLTETDRATEVGIFAFRSLA